MESYIKVEKVVNPPNSPIVRPFFIGSESSSRFSVIPKIGRVIASDENSYRYLVESIRRHPNQEQLQNMMTSAGFEDVKYLNLTGGIVALHVGFRY